MVTVPSGISPGQALQITSPSGTLLSVIVPDGILEGQQFQVQHAPQSAAPGTVVTAQNNAFAAGAVTAATPGLGGVVASAGNTANTVTNAVGIRNVKKSGDGVLVPCSACGADNRTKMVMGSRAQFNCGHCNALVFWRPRQVWLRDQGMPMEKSIHPAPGEKDSSGCCILM